jgi:hypothetical protein
VSNYLVLAVALGAIAVGAPSAAHAEGPQYVQSVDGACGFRVANDATPSGRFGGTNVWTGIVYVAVVYGDASAPSVNASCRVRVNGVDQGVVLQANTGTGAVASVDKVVFTASWYTDTVSLCADVTVNGVATETCRDATKSLVHDPYPMTCSVLGDLRPAVNFLLNPDRLYIAGDGDLYLEGARFIDCPPYEY